MKTMTNELRSKIQLRIKNKLDISDLIEGVSIKGEDLSHSIIKKFNRVNEDISGVNLAFSEIGEIGKVTNISGNVMKDVCLKGTKLYGVIYMRRCKCLRVNFSGAYMPYIEYQYTDFQNCTFCDCIMRIGSVVGMGANFDDKFFQELSKYWGIKVVKDE